MPDHEYDKLEQFFRKASEKADVPFNEDDWKKLEKRLDAAALNTAGRRGKHLVTGMLVGALMLMSTALWLGFERGSDPATDAVNNERSVLDGESQGDLPSPGSGLTAPLRADSDIIPGKVAEEQERTRKQEISRAEETPGGDDPQKANSHAVVEDYEKSGPGNRSKSNNKTGDGVTDVSGDMAKGAMGQADRKQESKVADDQPSIVFEESAKVDVNSPTVSELAKTGPDAGDLPDSERNKQKAVVQLPGAEEEETREAQAVVQEEHASDNKKHVPVPRLSLLLFFAPDFSGTSMALSASAGKAFGAMVHYHPYDRWSISAGVVKNQKVYTGAGEDYHPPRNYWKYYTNGVIPESIDGSCSILEFPLMIQYTAFEGAKSRWNIGLGASSYLMQSESYRYSFSQPNPGAKEGWDSRASSRFFFNMMNLTVGYERQIIPGLMLGVEPYVKIPLEEIGWSNLKLFSSGASFTLRYTIVRKKNLSIPVRSRGPD